MAPASSLPVIHNAKGCGQLRIAQHNLFVLGDVQVVCDGVQPGGSSQRRVCAQRLRACTLRRHFQPVLRQAESVAPHRLAPLCSVCERDLN